MKNLIYLLLCVTLSASCVEKSSQAATSKNAPADNKPSPADLGDLYQYYHADPNTLDKQEENRIIEKLADKNLSAVRTASGVYIHTQEKGAGAQVKWGDPISVDYKGMFMNGKEFDSSYSRGEPIKFRVGQMNAGWNEALPFLTRGTKATFYIPSHMGYGKKGFPGYVGPDEILVFDVDVHNDSAQ